MIQICLFPHYADFSRSLMVRNISSYAFLGINNIRHDNCFVSSCVGGHAIRLWCVSVCA